ncbi:MAG: BON domain-containing protein [Magnetococcales bacterium]|nr:BON domain-containing protein [Magnetococcales bacterium]
MFRSALKAIAVVVSLSTLSACAPAVMVGGGLLGTSMVGERRSADEYVEDNWVAWQLRRYYVMSDIVRVANVNVSVFRGKVLLTGAAGSQEEIDEAVRIAKATRGVHEVDSELRVQHETALELAEDALISNRVKVKLLADTRVRGLDIKVETTKGVVYLTGLAQTVAERDQAVVLAREVPGVKEVVSYIEVSYGTYPVESHDSVIP